MSHRSRVVDVAERRARLARRHRLVSRVDDGDVVGVADALVGFHATDPATVFLSARARIGGFEVADLERALYEDETLTKHLCMRRTLFVVPTALLPVVQAACSDAIVAAERRRFEREIEAAGIAADGVRWLRAAERATLRELEARGAASGAQLSRAVPHIQAKIRFGEGKTWGGEIGVAGRVFTILSAQGQIRRGRPIGSWTSSQHRWTLQRGAGAPARLPELVARAELVRRYLRAFGPAPVADIVWWTGLGVTKVKHALAELRTVEVELDSGPGLLLAEDIEPAPPVEPWVALLPALDPTVMGWQRRDWYLGPHGPLLFDRNGNAGPTVWCDGRVVGGWGQRRDGAVAYRVLEDIGAEAVRAVAGEAARLEAWLGPTPVTPRFATPLSDGLRRT